MSSCSCCEDCSFWVFITGPKSEKNHCLAIPFQCVPQIVGYLWVSVGDKWILRSTRNNSVENSCRPRFRIPAQLLNRISLLIFQVPNKTKKKKERLKLTCLESIKWREEEIFCLSLDSKVILNSKIKLGSGEVSPLGAYWFLRPIV